VILLAVCIPSARMCSRVCDAFFNDYIFTIHTHDSHRQLLSIHFGILCESPAAMSQVHPIEPIEDLLSLFCILRLVGILKVLGSHVSMNVVVVVDIVLWIVHGNAPRIGL